MEEDTDQADEQSLLSRFQSHFAPESPPPEQPQAEEAPAPEGEPEAVEQPPAEQAQPVEDDSIDFEWNGKQYLLPKELADLKEQAMLKADYTRKTQELADLRRHAIANAEQQRAAMEFQKATSQEHRDLQQTLATLAQYKAVDWTSLDMETAFRYRQQVDQLRDKQSDLEKSLGQKQQEFMQGQNQKRAEMAKSAYDFISKRVTGFGPDSVAEKAVAKYADSDGMPLDAFVNGALTYPQIAVWASKAMELDQLKQGKTAAVKAVQKAPPVVKPGSVTGQSAANDKQLKDLRAQFKKSGDIRDAARLLVAAKRKG